MLLKLDMFNYSVELLPLRLLSFHNDLRI